MGNVIDMQFLPIKLPPVYGPPLFYKSTHIALDENHRGNCSGLMVPTSKILGIGSPPIKCLFSKNNVKTYQSFQTGTHRIHCFSTGNWHHNFPI